MKPASEPVRVDTAAVREQAWEMFRHARWADLSGLASSIPRDWTAEWLPVVDRVAFGKGQVGEYAEAIELLRRAFEIEPSHRRASALAYLHYAALLRHKTRKPRLDDPEAYRKGFERWITEALRLEPGAITDRYRLGVYYSSILSGKDVKALDAFVSVIRLCEARPTSEREGDGRVAKRYVQSLYGAARSAFRLGRIREAKRFIFKCIRVDSERDRVEPTFKLFLAAKVLVADGKLDDAERGLRLALERDHDGPRDYVYALLAEIALRRGQPREATRWIEDHIRPHHRKPYVWRLLGDCAAAAGDFRRATKLYKSALLKDHGGRHKTLLRMGTAFEKVGQRSEARRAYEQALAFRRRRFQSDDPEALQALARLYEEEGDLERARDAYRSLAALPMFTAVAQESLERLAG